MTHFVNWISAENDDEQPYRGRQDIRTLKYADSYHHTTHPSRPTDPGSSIHLHLRRRFSFDESMTLSSNMFDGRDNQNIGASHKQEDKSLDSTGKQIACWLNQVSIPSEYRVPCQEHHDGKETGTDDAETSEILMMMSTIRWTI